MNFSSEYISDCIDDPILHLFGKMRMHRQTHDLHGEAVGNGKTAVCGWKLLVSHLPMQRLRIVDCRRDAGLRQGTLSRIAEETGGRYYDASGAGTLADDLRYTGRGVTTVEEHDLWHMPIVLLLLVGLLTAEWGYRRVVGLP